MLADGGALGHRVDHGPPKVLRVWAGEADALDALDRVARPEQLADLRPDLGREIAPPRVDVLAEQGELSHAFACEPRHLRRDLTWASAHLASANGRHDAVGALRVATHRDLYPGLEPALAVHRQLTREAPVVDAESPACDAEPAGSQPLAEMRDRARPERDVDVRIEIEEPLALRFGVATPDRDHLLRVAPLDRGSLREMRRELLIGLLADRAGIEDENVGLVLRGRLAETELLQHALDPLTVVSVHLAAEGRDVVPAHGPECYPWSFRTRPPCGSSGWPRSRYWRFRGRPSSTSSSRAQGRVAVSGWRRSPAFTSALSFTSPRPPPGCRR